MPRKGQKMTVEQKIKCRLAKLGKKMPDGFVPWNKNLKGWNLGDKNPSWKGGISNQYRTPNLEKIAGRRKPEQCELCGALGRICFDHDHKTGKFRGWICHRCNSALGLVRDNAELLTEMVEYIKENISPSQ